MEQKPKEQQEIHLPKISINNNYYLDSFKNDYNLDSEYGLKSNTNFPFLSSILKLDSNNLSNHNININQKSKNQISVMGSKDTNATKNIVQIKQKKKPTQKDNYKHSTFNLIRRVKKLVFDSLMKFDNIIISKLYNDIGNGIYVKKLFKNNHSQIKHTGTLYNKALLSKTQGEIFSEEITTRFTNFPLDHNKKLINMLLNEKDEEKRKIFQNLFNRTLLECIDHLIGKNTYQELEGLEEIYKNEMMELGGDEEYKNKLNYILNNIEKIFNERKPRIKKVTKKD